MRLIRNSSSVTAIIFYPNRLTRKLYNWTLHWGKTKHAKASLFGIALAESSFFPIPPDILLIAMTVADRYKWWLYASLATLGSVLGAVIGFYIGSGLFETIGKPIVELYHLEKYFEVVKIKYAENAFLAIFTAAFTPIPFKVFTIAGGVFNISLPTLILGSILGRGMRFFTVALAIRIFGKRISDTIEKYFDIFSFVFMILLIGGFFAIRLLK